MSLRIRKGDTVVVISGRDKGKRGRVLRVLPKKMRAIVEGVNLVKKHMRRTREDEKGGIVEIPAPIHLSNLLLYCKNCDRGVRFGVKILEDGTKVRVCKRCQSQL